MGDALRDRWNDLARRLDLRGDVDAVWRDLVARYTEPRRRYHNLDHVAACLRVFDAVRDDAQDADAVEAALWFHDAVYEPGDPRNEARSAELVRTSLTALGLDAERVERIASLVLATDHRHGPSQEDGRLIADIDLSILASPWPEYTAYGDAIRKEAALPDDAFREKRAAFLRSMVAKPSIFHTPRFRAAHEARARKNLQDELDALTGV